MTEQAINRAPGLCSCGRPTNAGRTYKNDSALCLICEVAEAMETFVYRDIPRPHRWLSDKRYRATHADAVQAHRAARRSAQQDYWKAYYQKNREQIRRKRARVVLETLRGLRCAKQP